MLQADSSQIKPPRGGSRIVEQAAFGGWSLVDLPEFGGGAICHGCNVACCCVSGLDMKIYIEN